MIFSMPLCIFTLFLLMTVILYRFSSSPRKKDNTLPPSPPGLPIIGNFHQISGLAHTSLQALSRRYGHVMLLKLGSVPTIVVSSAEAAEGVMKTHDLSFASRAPSVMGDILLYGSRDISFSPYGEYWRQLRRIFVLHLLNAKRLQSFRHVIEEEVSSMMSNIRSALEGRVNISELLVSHSKNILVRVALGRKYFNEEEERSNKFGDLMAEFMQLLGEFPIGDYIPSLAWVDNLSGLLRRARRNAHEIDIFIEHVLDDHLQNQESPATHQVKCIVDILLSLGEEGNMDISLTRDNIKAIILDMFSAGTHTTSSTMEWIMAELMRHPAKLKKVQEEVRKKVKSKPYIIEEDISKMVYFKAAIKETLRLHPPGPLLVPREAIHSSKLCGYHIPAKTRVLVNVWAIGRDPKYWETPDEFIPERFIDNPLDYKGLDFQFLPFGAGRRGCPGISFGVMIVEIALANLLYHFNWDMTHGIKSEEMDMTEMAGIALRKKSNLILLATPQDF